MSYLNYAYIGPLSVSTLLTISIVFWLMKSSIYRSPKTWFALVSALSSLSNSILNTLANFRIISHNGVAESIFYNTFVILGFVPGLIGFYRICSEMHNNIGACIIIAGYIWALVLFLIIIFVNATNNTSGHVTSYAVVSLMRFGHIGLAIVIIFLFMMTYHHLHGKVKKSLAAYTFLCIVFEIFFFFLNNVNPSETIYSLLKLVFTDLSMSVAILISVFFGHLWTTEGDFISDDAYGKYEISSNHEMSHA